MRLTDEWTPTLEGAFGEVGKLARGAELFVKEAIESWGWEVKDNESGFADQVAGRDLLIKKPTWANFYSIDVKANMNEFGVFNVESNENGWLFNPKKKSDRIWHVNQNTGWMAWYGRNEMKQYIINNSLTNTGLVRILPTQKLSFITRSRYNKNEKTKIHLDHVSERRDTQVS